MYHGPPLRVSVCQLVRTRHQQRMDRAGRDPIEHLRSEIVEIEGLLSRADRHAAGRATGAWVVPGGGDAVSQFEASPMALREVGELVFRVQRLRASGSRWLRGWLRTETMRDAQLLLDSGRLGAAQRGQVARAMLRRLDNLNALVDHW